jgi:hypothetical protein
MAASSSKKRKISDECPVFQGKGTSLYLFTEFQQKPVCLVCIESIASIKEYNLKRHYETKHAAKFDAIQGQFRNGKITQLKKLEGQQFTFQRQNVESESTVEVSCILSERIASKSKPFCDREFIKECIELAPGVFYVDPKNTYLLKLIWGNCCQKN